MIIKIDLLYNIWIVPNTQMPFRFLDYSYSSAIWSFDPNEQNTLFMDGYFEKNIVRSIYSLTITTHVNNQPLIIPSLKVFTNLQIVEINGDITGLTDLGNTDGPASIRVVTLRNTRISTLDNLNMTKVTMLSLQNNIYLQLSHIPPNVDTCIIKKQSFGDIYLNSKLTHLSIGQHTTIGRIFNIGMNAFLSYLYISEELIHPYDFGSKNRRNTK